MKRCGQSRLTTPLQQNEDEIREVLERFNEAALDFEVLHVDECFIIQGTCVLAQILRCVLLVLGVE